LQENRALKLAGIIGGIGPESTQDYYRLIIALYRQRNPDRSYPSILINSINLRKVLDLMEADKLSDVTEYLLTELDRLYRAGADFGALSANTPHIVFDALQQRSPLPLVSIVKVTSRAAKSQGLKRVGLLGTRFTMQAHFYQDTFAEDGITVVMPSLEEQNLIHDKYMNELVAGIFLPETRGNLLAIAERLRIQEGIEGLILAGTELPLILRDVKQETIPFLDTTALHVEEIVNQILC
jgi:aspartate racemase